jgi:phosphoserine phosphatase
VKKLKADRDELRSQISKRIKEIKKLKSEHSNATKKFPVKKNPKSVRQEIEKLEMFIETEALSFKREQKIMDKIRNLKKIYSEIQALSGEIEKTDNLSNLIDNLKKEADSVHKNIQVIAAESHKKHEAMIEKSKSMKDLKKKEKSAYKQFTYMKKRFGDLNQALRNKLSRLNELSKLLERTKSENKQKFEKKEENILKMKTEKVEEKIKKGEKLTTEDLLVFQGSNENK